MNFIKKLFNFYIFSNLHVALASTSLAFISIYNMSATLELKYLYLIFLSTLFAYQFIRLADDFFNQKLSLKLYLKQFSKNKFLLFGVLIFSIIYFLIFFKWLEILILIPVSILTLGYAIPFITMNEKKYSLRNIPALKIFIIALDWSLLTVWFPVQNHTSQFSFWIELLQRFIFIVAITIPFDIRDYEKDLSELVTLPQKTGIVKAKNIAILLMVVFFILIFFKMPLKAENILSELGIFILTILLIYHADKKKNIYYTAFWIEAIPIFWVVLLTGFGFIIK